MNTGQVLSVSLIFAAGVGCAAPPSGQQRDNPENSPLAEWMSSPESPVESPAGEGDGGDEDPDPEVERCDGRDNDGDGLIDEDTNAGSCTPSEGEPGILTCIDGRMRCAVCAPGEIRHDSCACGIDRVDTCDNDGQWAIGPCDGCTSSQRVPCGFCGTLGADGECVNPGVCEPGDEMFVRCDECPDGNCGAHTCVGKKVRCTAQCTWETVEGCQVRQKQCDRDTMRVDSCGQCGEVALTCDGCFWNFTDTCEEYGECTVGATRSVQCDACGGGFKAGTVRCTSECRWSEPTGCSGCRPGTYTRTHGCACTSEVAVEEYRCELRNAPNSCGVGIGVETGHHMLTECPPVTCRPGQTQRSGGECRACTNLCEWGAWGGCSDDGPSEPPTEPPCACTNGQTRTVSCNDFCGNTTTETCNDCSWQRDPCPPCNH